MPDLRPHDLLVLAGWQPADAPEWVAAALRPIAWVVVRRAACADGLTPVGVRGPHRAQRYGACVDAGHVIRVVKPEHLLDKQPALVRRTLPAMAWLARVRTVLADHGVPGGPTGSVGFELASGIPVVGPASDLDLLLRPAVAFDVPAARQLWALLAAQAQQAGCRIDVQVEGAHGAFALADYAQHRRVMLRTPHGAILTDAPWSDGAHS